MGLSWFLVRANVIAFLGCVIREETRALELGSVEALKVSSVIYFSKQSHAELGKSNFIIKWYILEEMAIGIDHLKGADIFMA